MMKIPVILGSVALLAAGCASHERGGSYASSSSAASGGSGSSVLKGESASSNLSPQDSHFIREAAQAGLAEVKLGQLAQEKGQNEALKTYGQMLVNDHQTANQELMSIATRKGVDIPQQMSAQQAEMISRLSSAQGAEFDKLAAQENVKAHEKVIQEFQAAQDRVQDPELKAFIQKTLPTLQSHLQHAEHMEGAESAVGGSESLESQPNQSSGSQSSDSVISRQPSDNQLEPSSSGEGEPHQAPGSPPMNADPNNQQ